MFVRGSSDAAALLRVLGLEHDANRQAIISAYRRLAFGRNTVPYHRWAQSQTFRALALYCQELG